MSILSMTAESYKKILHEADKPVLVEFWAPWCSYCRRLAPALEQVAEEQRDALTVGQVNIDDEPALTSAERVELIPTLLLYRGGQLLGSIVSPESKSQLETFIEDRLRHRE